MKVLVSDAQASIGHSKRSGSQLIHALHYLHHIQCRHDLLKEPSVFNSVACFDREESCSDD
jgi:hypothetical protein